MYGDHLQYITVTVLYLSVTITFILMFDTVTKRIMSFCSDCFSTRTVLIPDCFLLFAGPGRRRTPATIGPSSSSAESFRFDGKAE